MPNKINNLKKVTKIAVLVLILVVVLVGTIFLGRETSRYFAKASSCSPQKVSVSQVTDNTAVINWETSDNTQGRVEYGTTSTSLTFSTPEATAGKTHNVPLTLLTPNTVYYYLVAVGDTRCDSTGQKCNLPGCVPWSFTTSAVNPPPDIETPLPTVTPNGSVTTPGLPTGSPSQAQPTGSAFCTALSAAVGESSLDTAKWSSVKQYDLDNNGVINGKDASLCARSGR